MAPLWVYRGLDGGLVLTNGMTRATRIAKLTPGTLIRVEVVGELNRLVRHYPTKRVFENLGDLGRWC